VNDFGQVLGGFDVWRGGRASDLWLKDPVEGLLSVDDLVVGDADHVALFQSWQGFEDLVISQVEPLTEFGIIAGTIREQVATNSPSSGFILTPRPKS
jgi:hypothetical protein